MSFIQSLIEKYIENYRRQRSWQKLATVLAAVVVFCTTYALILPAITWEKQLICEQPEHVHTDACYEEIDLSEIAELATDSEEYGRIIFATDSNAKTAKVLVCDIPEHTHTEACFDAPPAEKTRWLCGMEQHIHDESCYFEDGSLKCTLQEHIHTEECDCIIMDDVTLVEDATLSELENATLSELEDATLSEIDIIDQILTAEAEDGIQFTAEGFMPDGAELVVQALNDEEKESISENVDDIPTKAKAYAYDIKIMLDGEEYKCDDSIRISMTGIEVSDEERVHGYHLPDVDKDSIDQLAAATASETVKVEEVGIIQVDDEVIFDAEEFSVYYFTVDFTVDFKYNDEQYSIDGHSEGISLSEVMYRLGVRVDAPASDADYDDATGSDADYELASGSEAEFDFPTLSARELGVESITWEGEAEPYLTVSEIEDDWWIAPTGEPFTVSGTLTLYFEDGSTEVIMVSDASTYTFNEGATMVFSDRILSSRKHTIPENATVYINGTVKVDSEIHCEKGAKITFGPNFPTDDKNKIALQFTNTDACIFVGDMIGLDSLNSTSLTITGRPDQNFIIDGGARWGGTVNPAVQRGTTNSGVKNRDKALIQVGIKQTSDHLPTSTNYGLDLTLTNVTLQNNDCSNNHSGYSAQQGGAGIYLNNRSGKVNLNDVIIRDCYHVNNGAGMFFYDNAGYGHGSDKSTYNFTKVEITGCYTEGNNTTTQGGVGGTISTTGDGHCDVTMADCNVHHNYSAKSGGVAGWQVPGKLGTLKIRGGIYHHNTAANAGGAFYNVGILDIDKDLGGNGVEIFENSAGGNGGAIYHSVYGSDASTASDRTDNSLYIKQGLKILNNTAGSNGGGIYFESKVGQAASKMTMKLSIDGGEISENQAKNGGGIYFTHSSGARYSTSIQINNGKINNNTATTGNGGGIYFARNSGDTYVSPIEIVEGEVVGNRAAGSGGGIYASQVNIKTNKSDGEDTFILTKNTAKYGGGIYASGASSTTIWQGYNYIEGNTAANGGGVYLADSANMILSDGFVRANQATGTWNTGTGTARNTDDPSKQSGVGGGIYLWKANLTVGAPIVEGGLNIVKMGVYGNMADSAADDVYTLGSSTKITISDNGWGTGNYRMLLVNDEEGNGKYYDKDVTWYEDFHNPDSSYVSTYWRPASATHTNQGRFRQNDTYEIDYDLLQTNNQFINATIGPGRMYKLEYYGADGTTLLERETRFKGETTAIKSITVGTTTYSNWATETDGSGTVYKAGDTFTFAQDTKIYATNDPRPSKYKLVIKKIGKGDINNPLSGAVFNIYKKSGSSWTDVPGAQGIETDEEGRIYLNTELDIDGIYKLQETNPPIGYTYGDEISYFTTTVTGSGTDISIKTFTCDENGVETSYIYVKANYNGTANITVNNKTDGGTTLPTTGGCGRDIIYILGLLLLAGGATGLAVTENKRKRRSG